MGSARSYQYIISLKFFKVGTLQQTEIRIKQIREGINFLIIFELNIFGWAV